MKTNKYIVIISVVITFLSLILSAYFTFISKCIYSPYFTNLFIGIFCSGLFAIIISVIGYQSEKKKILYEYIKLLCDVRNRFIKYKPYSENYVLSSLQSLSILIYEDVPRLSKLVHEISFMPIIEKAMSNYVQESYNYIIDIYDKHASMVTSTIAMLETMEWDNEMVKQNYSKLDDAFIRWEDSIYNGKKYDIHSVTIPVEKLTLYIKQIAKYHNRPTSKF